jgi:hypothetical protein
MQPHLGAVLGMLIALSWTDLAAQEESSTCSLLTAADINAAVGAKVGEPHRTDMGVSPGAASKTNGNCMWKVGDQGMVSVGVMPAAKGAEREAGLAKLNQVYDQLKAKHWTEEKQVFSNGWCSTMTPPASEKDSPIMTGCMAEAKGLAIGVTYLNPKQKLALDKAKGLLDKVIGHL